MTISVNFPVTIVDNFFNEPFKLIELANNLEFFRDDEGRWPGVRSKDLVKLYPKLANKITEKILSLYYNFNIESATWESNVLFQKVSPKYLGGWIHQDLTTNLTSIVYFCQEGFGTSIYKIKDIKNYAGNVHTDKKVDSFKNNSLVSEYEEFRKKNNSNFEESIIINSKFNRLVVFEGLNQHGANNFFNNDNSDRLTMVIFIRGIKTNFTPIGRTKLSTCMI